MSDFGYSDDSFADYSWFCNSIGSNSDGGSGDGGWNSGDPNNKFNKFGVRLAIILIILAFLLMVVNYFS